MWLHTIDGFFSVVRKPGEELLTIRARARADLERLRDRYLPELGEIVVGGGTDYPTRAQVDDAAFGRALAKVVTDLRYANFKSEVATRLGPQRAHILGEVWQALHAVTALERSSVAVPDAFGGVVMDARGRVLLREPAGHYGGYVWTFPKGRPERGESPERAALREVREETGVEARIVGDVPGSFGGDTSTTAFFLMRSIAEHGDFDPGETSAVRWAGPEEARELIRATRSARGRTRDLAVLAAALRAARTKEQQG